MYLDISNDYYYQGTNNQLWPLYGWKTFIEKNNIVIGWGVREGPIIPLLDRDRHPFVVENGVVKIIQENQFEQYGITGRLPPGPTTRLIERITNPNFRKRKINPNN